MKEIILKEDRYGLYYICEPNKIHSTDFLVVNAKYRDSTKQIIEIDFLTDKNLYGERKMIKELIEKYKKIKEETIIIKENIPPKIETIQLEREFPIEVIASTIENRLLAPLEDIEDLVAAGNALNKIWDAIVGGESDFLNINYRDEMSNICDQFDAILQAAKDSRKNIEE